MIIDQIKAFNGTNLMPQLGKIFSVLAKRDFGDTHFRQVYDILQELHASTTSVTSRLECDHQAKLIDRHIVSELIYMSVRQFTDVDHAGVAHSYYVLAPATKMFSVRNRSAIEVARTLPLSLRAEHIELRQVARSSVCLTYGADSFETTIGLSLLIGRAVQNEMERRKQNRTRVVIPVPDGLGMYMGWAEPADPAIYDVQGQSLSLSRNDRGSCDYRPINMLYPPKIRLLMRTFYGPREFLNHHLDLYAAFAPLLRDPGFVDALKLEIGNYAGFLMGINPTKPQQSLMLEARGCVAAIVASDAWQYEAVKPDTKKAREPHVPQPKRTQSIKGKTP